MVGITLRWHDRRWEIQHDRGVAIRQLPSKEAKAPPNRKIRIREGQVQPLTESDKEKE